MVKSSVSHKMQIRVKHRLRVKYRLQTFYVQCNHFHYWILTINVQLTWVTFRIYHSADFHTTEADPDLELRGARFWFTCPASFSPFLSFILFYSKWGGLGPYRRSATTSISWIMSSLISLLLAFHNGIIWHNIKLSLQSPFHPCSAGYILPSVITLRSLHKSTFYPQSVCVKRKHVLCLYWAVVQVFFQYFHKCLYNLMVTHQTCFLLIWYLLSCT